MAGPGNVWKKVRWSLAHRGVLLTLRVAIWRLRTGVDEDDSLEPHPFDLEHGVDTSGLIGGGDLTMGHAHDVHITAYVGIAPSRFEEAIRRWMRTVSPRLPESYTFVDLGCGKGRAVMLASELSFRSVVGVELNTELARMAEENIEIWKRSGRALCPIRIVCGDATEFELPEGNCLVYLANPFGAPVMRRLLEKLQARSAKGAGTVDVVYQNPEQEAVFSQAPAFVRLWSEVIPLSEKDATVDPVFTPTDLCNAYRLFG